LGQFQEANHEKHHASAHVIDRAAAGLGGIWKGCDHFWQFGGFDHTVSDIGTPLSNSSAEKCPLQSLAALNIRYVTL
jgi:hypothetical protein